MSFTYLYIKTLEELENLVSAHNCLSNYVVIDLETTGLNPHNDKIVHCVISGIGTNSAFLFDAELAPALAKLTPLLILHNFKFDYNFLYRAGIDLRGKAVRDTMLMHHLFNENLDHGLDDIIKEHWNDNYKEMFWSRLKDRESELNLACFDDGFNGPVIKLGYQDAPLEEQLEYACKDVIYTAKLYSHLVDRLSADQIPTSLVEHVHALALSLYDTELSGIAVDFEYLNNIGVKLKTRIEELKVEMRAACPYDIKAVEVENYRKELDKRKTLKGKSNVEMPEFNFDSSPQLKTLVYEKLQLKEQHKWNKFTKKRTLTLDDDALEELNDTHDFIKLLREYRGHNKVFGSYIEGTLERQVQGRIYPSFSINGTVSGRISSSNPNMQQLPRAGGIRGIYCPDFGYKLISCDYGMLEVVVAAHFSQDKNLLKIIREGASKHDITAAALGIPRQTAKTVNFGMQYMCGPDKVAQIIGGSKQDGQLAWNKYWEAYAGERAVINECIAKVDRGEAIVNLFGRKRRFPTVFESKGQREAAYRQAYSSLISGTGADITSKAFYTADKHLRELGFGKGLFSVHDELIITAKDEYVSEAETILKQTMIDGGKILSVPLGVDCSGPMSRWED